MHKSIRTAFVAAAAAAVLGGASSAGANVHPPSPGGARPGAAVPRLDWKPCTGREGFECATAKVPLDYRRPGGRLIDLAVIRRKAADGGRRIGSLFMNPGGPAGAGTSSLPDWYEKFPAGVRERFDIVSWDPRGAGQSTAVRCFDNDGEAKKFLEPLPPGFPAGARQRQTWTSIFAGLGKRCQDRDAELLRHISTADTARDLDMLRQATGDTQLTYWGLSYGTFLGATYANLFPGTVRALILDGNISPRVYTNNGKTQATRGFFLRAGADLSAAATLNAFLDLCGRAPASRCAFSAGTPKATRAKFEDLMRRLQRQPQGAWTYNRITGDTVNGLYITDPGWTHLAGTLQSLWQHRTPAIPEIPPGVATTFAQQPAIQCSESPNPRNPQRYAALEKFSAARASHAGHFWAWDDERCAQWPATAADRYTGPWNRPTAHPILVINTTHDPSTPHPAAQSMARELASARLITVNGYGHTTLLNPRSACLDRHTTRYLITGTPPAADTTCSQDTIPFQAPMPHGAAHAGTGTGTTGYDPARIAAGTAILTATAGIILLRRRNQPGQ